MEIGVGDGNLGYHDFDTGNDRAFNELWDGTQSVQVAFPRAAWERGGNTGLGTLRSPTPPR